MNRTPVEILLVEDNPMDAALTRRMLQALSPEFLIATRWVENAELALAEVRIRRYDLALLDYQLPGANGLEVLAEIRRLPPLQQPAVIMLTASGNEKIAVEAMKSGARDYLRKDELDVPQLLRAIISALAQKRLQDQVARHMAQTQADLQMARQLQYAMLPQRFPQIPAGAAPADALLRFHAHYVSTLDLGGDFYDVFPISDQAAGVLICDVMGHGVRAALVTAMMRALVEELQPLARDPGAFLSRLNREFLAILKNADDTLFATAFYGILSPAAGELQYANSGHPLPLLIRPDGRGIQELDGLKRGQGPALGLIEQAAYPSARCAIGPGDRLLLYTDGLTEELGSTGEEFGRDRLFAAVRTGADLPMPSLLDRLIEHAKDHSATGDFADDVCLLGVEVAPAPAGGEDAP